MSDPGVVSDANLLIVDGVIRCIGSDAEIRPALESAGFSCDGGGVPTLDAAGKAIIPGLVDAHTHACFTGSREDELEMRLSGTSYLDILAAGGGILRTVRTVRESSEDELVDATVRRLRRMQAHGTTTCEIKSGYGLDTQTEVRQLRAARRAASEVLNGAVDVVTTFLGAHALPLEYRHDRSAFVDSVCREMIPHVARLGLAEYCDVFCDMGVFDVAETRRVFEAAMEHGLKLRLHADEIQVLGGVDLAVDLGAASVDHLTATGDGGIERLADSETTAILLPGTSFCLKGGHYAPGRAMVDRGCIVALATDCNPGSCFTESMQAVMAHACYGMGLTPGEALVAGTINAAYSLGRDDRTGSLEEGKAGDLVVLDVPDYRHIVYNFGVNHAAAVVKDGNVVYP